MLQQNSRHIALLVACLLVICGPTAFAGDNNNDLILTVHLDVNLGTIDAELFNPATQTWTPLTSAEKSVKVRANIPFTLTVRAANTGGGFQTADLTRFKIKGGVITDFKAFSYGGMERTLTLASGGLGLHEITDIRYQYIPCWRDAPGEYAVTVTYTLTAP